jgi:hypothetical protein
MMRFGAEALIFGGVCLFWAATTRFELGNRRAFENARKSKGTVGSAFYPFWLYGGLAAVVVGAATLLVALLV